MDLAPAVPGTSRAARLQPRRHRGAPLARCWPRCRQRRPMQRLARARSTSASQLGPCRPARHRANAKLNRRRPLRGPALPTRLPTAADPATGRRAPTYTAAPGRARMSLCLRGRRSAAHRREARRTSQLSAARPYRGEAASPVGRWCRWREAGHGRRAEGRKKGRKKGSKERLQLLLLLLLLPTPGAALPQRRREEGVYGLEGGGSVYAKRVSDRQGRDGRIRAVLSRELLS